MMLFCMANGFLMGQLVEPELDGGLYGTMQANLLPGGRGDRERLRPRRARGGSGALAQGRSRSIGIALELAQILEYAERPGPSEALAPLE